MLLSIAGRQIVTGVKGEREIECSQETQIACEHSNIRCWI
jgi:hypothetical protein